MDHNRPLSETLREVYNDMVEAYADARLNENVAGQERISKHISSLTKQIKDQEIHERRVVPVDEVWKYNGIVGDVLGSILKRLEGEPLDASAAIIETQAQLEIVAKSELGVER